MKKLWNGKRMLALLLTLVMLTGALPLTTLAEQVAPPEAAEDAQAPAQGDLAEALGADETYYEVEVALPAGLTEEEAAEITLPEPMMLPAGTLIYAVAEPTRPNYNFTGWYYDDALTQPADGGDAVERNLTLYPSFAPLQNYDDEFRINYMSTQDVEPDFTIEIVARGLSEGQIREQMKATDLSKVEGAEEYVLERLAPDAAALIPDERVRTLALDACLKAQAETLEGTLTEALSALTVEADPAESEPAENEPAEGEAAEEEDAEPERALDDAVIAELVAYYAPVEATKSEAMRAADLIDRAKAAGLDTREVTGAQLSDLLTEPMTWRTCSPTR